MRKILTAIVLLITIGASAQMPGMGRMGGGNMNIGHFYGKIVDSTTGKGVEGVTLQLTGSRFDTVKKKMTTGILTTVLTEPNGDFSLENLSVMGSFTLKISTVGYKQKEQKLSFGLKMPQGGGGEGSREQMLNMVDKDLGNIKIQSTVADLGNVTVTATKALFEMGVDRKIFNVDKNLNSTGQTATEIMKSIPTLSVDIDGNVTMRNATPQLFLDGRPTTMTMDQIPADIIDKVELITNPSAKFDASGGNAGIINIVLKKNRKTGYNGGVRAGVDSRGKINLGGDINLRQNKINLFLVGMYNERKSISNTFNDRINIDKGTPFSQIYQTGNPINNGYFAFLRGGFDYLIDNRNTITVAANYNKGQFKSNDNQRVDSLLIANPSFNKVLQNSVGNFKNLGSQLSFKHIFAEAGHELTADANYNSSNNDNSSYINTLTYKSLYERKGPAINQQSLGGGTTKNYIFQTDYANPITENQKLELGGRLAIRDFENTNNQYFKNPFTNKFVLMNALSSNYSYTDKVYAAYINYSIKVKKWSYQFGLRAESSTYDGNIIRTNRQGQDSLSSFKVDFPVQLFPSAFITYKMSDKEDIQANYSRRINRPNFFQLMPFIDYSDPYNLSVGNAGLQPEFTNSFEISYSNNYKKGSNFLASTYFKHNSNLITRLQYPDANPDDAHFYSSADSVLINSYVNANSSMTYGLELTNKMPITKWWEMMLNVNLYNSEIKVDETTKQAAISNQRVSWFAKTNNTFKFLKTWSVQLSGEYYAKTVLPQEGGRGGGFGGRGGGGMMFGGGPQAAAQGYINPRYSLDIAIRKDWTWKGGNSASLTLSMNDFLRTQLYSTYSESPYLMQTSQRRRDPQVLRLNFSYRFGKFDINLFKRKSMKDVGGGTDMIIGG